MSASTADQRETFTDDERAAMKERAQELKTATRRKSASAKENREEGERDLLEKIAELTGAERAAAERIHAIVTERAPHLAPRTWYGMPAYARDGRVVLFFQPAAKFKARYSTLGFNDPARLDDGTMWPVAYAITELTPADEERVAELVERAAG